VGDGIFGMGVMQACFQCVSTTVDDNEALYRVARGDEKKEPRVSRTMLVGGLNLWPSRATGLVAPHRFNDDSE